MKKVVVYIDVPDVMNVIQFLKVGNIIMENGELIAMTGKKVFA